MTSTWIVHKGSAEAQVRVVTSEPGLVEAVAVGVSVALGTCRYPVTLGMPILTSGRAVGCAVGRGVGMVMPAGTVKSAVGLAALVPPPPPRAEQPLSSKAAAVLDRHTRTIGFLGNWGMSTL